MRIQCDQPNTEIEVSYEKLDDTIQIKLWYQGEEMDYVYLETEEATLLANHILELVKTKGVILNKKEN